MDIKELKKIYKKKTGRVAPNDTALDVYFLNYKEYKNIKIKNDDEVKYFIEFCDFLKKEKNTYRLDFDSAAKKAIFNSSGGHCARCYKITMSVSSKKESLVGGVYAHIIPASILGPRTDFKMREEDPEFIKSYENGLWLCPSCHEKIDGSPKEFTVKKLKEFKKNIEKWVKDNENTNFKEESVKLESLKLKSKNLEIDINILKQEKERYDNKKIKNISDILPNNTTISNRNNILKITTDNIDKNNYFHIDCSNNETFIPEKHKTLLDNINDIRISECDNMVEKSMKNSGYYFVLEKTIRKEGKSKLLFFNVINVIENIENKEITFQIERFGEMIFTLDVDGKIKEVKKYILDDHFKFFLTSDFSETYKIIISDNKRRTVILKMNDKIKV